jgi:hypothetical protein
VCIFRTYVLNCARQPKQGVFEKGRDNVAPKAENKGDHGRCEAFHTAPFANIAPFAGTVPSGTERRMERLPFFRRKPFQRQPGFHSAF